VFELSISTSVKVKSCTIMHLHNQFSYLVSEYIGCSSVRTLSPTVCSTWYGFRRATEVVWTAVWCSFYGNYIGEKNQPIPVL